MHENGCEGQRRDAKVAAKGNDVKSNKMHQENIEIIKYTNPKNAMAIAPPDH